MGTVEIVNLENVRRFMKGRGYSEVELAREMGIAYSYLFRVLRGKRRPGPKFIQGLLQAGMDPREIFLPRALPNGNKEGGDRGGKQASTAWG